MFRALSLKLPWKAFVLDVISVYENQSAISRSADSGESDPWTIFLMALPFQVIEQNLHE